MIQRLFLFGFFLSIFFYSGAQDMEVTITNIRNDKGVLMIGLFNSKETFTKKIFKGENPKASTGEVKVVFKNIPPGDYAVSVFHDENSNGKIDTNFIGIPKEGFGFSNDAMGAFGPPSFEKAGVVVPKTKSVVMKLKYF